MNIKDAAENLKGFWQFQKGFSHSSQIWRVYL